MLAYRRIKISETALGAAFRVRISFRYGGHWKEMAENWFNENL